MTHYFTNQADSFLSPGKCCFKLQWLCKYQGIKFVIRCRII